jgi:hypothetical protein
MAIAPETPKRATAHGPIQQSPINEAIALMLIALPDVAMSFLSSFIFTPHDLHSQRRFFFGSHKSNRYHKPCSNYSVKTDGNSTQKSFTEYAFQKDRR